MKSVGELTEERFDRLTRKAQTLGEHDEIRRISDLFSEHPYPSYVTSHFLIYANQRRIGIHHVLFWKRILKQFQRPKPLRPKSTTPKNLQKQVSIADLPSLPESIDTEISEEDYQTYVSSLLDSIDEQKLVLNGYTGSKVEPRGLEEAKTELLDEALEGINEVIACDSFDELLSDVAGEMYRVPFTIDLLSHATQQGRLLIGKPIQTVLLSSQLLSKIAVYDVAETWRAYTETGNNELDAITDYHRVDSAFLHLVRANDLTEVITTLEGLSDDASPNTVYDAAPSLTSLYPSNPIKNKVIAKEYDGPELRTIAG